MLTRSEFVRLAELHMDAVFRLAFSMLRSRTDADDVTQTALLRLYETDKQFDNDDHVKNWLFRVTVNECRKHWRSPWSRMACLENVTADLVFEDTRTGELFQAIMALEQKYRTVIVLHYYEGYTVAEIAGLLGIPPGTVGTRLRRAREKLKLDLMEA